jgi:superfamily II DNA helicase RecQ
MQTILEILRTDNGGIQIRSPFFDVISLDAPQPRPVQRITAQMSANPELFEKLRAWRRAKAEEIDRPQYIIFNNKVLLELADIAPATEEALGTVKGIGPAKLELYGADILAITREFTSSPE